LNLTHFLLLIIIINSAIFLGQEVTKQTTGMNATDDRWL